MMEGPSFFVLDNCRSCMSMTCRRSYDASNERPGILIFITAGGAEP